MKVIQSIEILLCKLNIYSLITDGIINDSDIQVLIWLQVMPLVAEKLRQCGYQRIQSGAM